jgi:hypothetical protein
MKVTIISDASYVQYSYCPFITVWYRQYSFGCLGLANVLLVVMMWIKRASTAVSRVSKVWWCLALGSSASSRLLDYGLLRVIIFCIENSIIGDNNVYDNARQYYRDKDKIICWARLNRKESNIIEEISSSALSLERLIKVTWGVF